MGVVDEQLASTAAILLHCYTCQYIQCHLLFLFQEETVALIGNKIMNKIKHNNNY